MKKLHQQKGFTLVELAIVLTIIGLLIGGILKGQQLIANARVTSQVAQFQGLQAAYTTFQDTYAALPGDVNNATTRLPGCIAPNCADGNGNNIIGAGVPFGQTWTQGSAGEPLQFWTHLSRADLISGISGIAPNFGQGLPVAKVSGGMVIAELAGGVYSGRYATILQTTQNPGAVAGAQPMTPSQAAQIDRKLDDGASQTGSVIGYGVGANCVTAANTGYLENQTGRDCGVSFRFN
jgi:prepilin-type N-terminal cleavage/methylation domain-containing protein